jgi:acetyl-CoA C-acetyltransferase
VILGGARTPHGKTPRLLEGFSAPQLGGLAIRAALAKAGLSISDLDLVEINEAFASTAKLGVPEDIARKAPRSDRRTS